MQAFKDFFTRSSKKPAAPAAQDPSLAAAVEAAAAVHNAAPAATAAPAAVAATVLPSAAPAPAPTTAPDPIVDFVQQLLDSGRLLSPVTLDGHVLSSGGVVVPPGGDQTYGVNGWGLEPTAIGGRRSKGLDELRQELMALGQSDIAAEVPEFVIARDWAPAVPYGFAVEDHRFATPADLGPGMTDALWQQKIRNLNMAQNQEFSQALVNTHARDLWRGQPGGSFAPIDMAPFNAQAGTLAKSGITPIQFVAQSGNYLVHTFPRVFKLTPGQQHYYDYDSEASKAYRNHAVVSVFVDGQTDEAFTRMWRSFAKAIGGRNSV